MTQPSDNTQPRHAADDTAGQQPQAPAQPEPRGFHYGFVEETQADQGSEQPQQAAPGAPHSAGGNGQTPPQGTQPGYGVPPQQPAAPRRQPQRGQHNRDDSLWNKPGVLSNNSQGQNQPQRPAPIAPQQPRTPMGRKAKEPSSVSGMKTLPEGWPVGTFDNYQDAQAAVDMLSDTGEFPVKDLTIVGLDLMEVERVVGRLSWGRVIAGGAASGAWLGLFLGLMISFMQPSYSPFVFGIGLGVIFGIVSAAVPYAMTRRQRDFQTTTELVAHRYDVICHPDSARRARDMIAQWNLNRRTQ